jgi:hypothetical protein
MVSLSPSTQMLGQYLKSGYGSFLPYPFAIHYSLIIWSFSATDSIIKYIYMKKEHLNCKWKQKCSLLMPPPKNLSGIG